MRQRKIKDVEERLLNYTQFMIEEPMERKGHWKEVFGNDHPLYMELGCGKGQFIMGYAKAHPEWNFLAIEGQDSVALRALQKAAKEELPNVRFVIAYVKDIRDMFEDGELDGLFLNFSDPWPKERHAKRRLTYHQRLLQYRQILKESGEIQFKTDNEGLFDFTLEQIELAEMDILEMSRDLHNSEFAERNITTEYEDKFAGRGKNINYVRIRA